MNEKTQPIYIIRIVDNNPNTERKELVANLSNPVCDSNCDVSVYWYNIINHFIKHTQDLYKLNHTGSKDYVNNYINIEIWIGESKVSTECNLSECDLVYKLFEFRGIELLNDQISDDFEFVLSSFFKKTPSKLDNDHTCKYLFAF